jgi:hypothetical protein
MLEIIRSKETRPIAVVTGSKEKKLGKSVQYKMQSQQASKKKKKEGIYERQS